MRSIVMLFLWLVMMTSCCCGAVKTEVENSEKDLIDLEKYGIVCDTSGFVLLLKGDTLCAIDRGFKSEDNYNSNNKLTYMIKLFYSIKTISTPTTLNITDYTLDEEKSYVEFDDESIEYINTMEGCLLENRKYSVNCYYVYNEFNYKLSSVALAVYFDREHYHLENDYYTDHYSKNSIDDITYKMNSDIGFYMPNPKDIQFYSQSIGGEFDFYYEHWFHTPYSNGYIRQSIYNDEYQFTINEEAKLVLEESDSYSILLSPGIDGSMTIGYTKLNKDDERICCGYGWSDNIDNWWASFYVNECVYKMSKSELTEKFSSLSKQLFTSFDNTFDNALTAEKRVVEDKSTNTNKGNELSTQECYYIETLSDSYYNNYEGYFVKDNTFTLVFVSRYKEKQLKVVIPITDPTSISLKEMNCKESEIEISRTRSKLSFEEYYGNCDIENNYKLTSDLSDYIYNGNYSFSSVDKTITYRQYTTISLKATTCDIFDQSIARITILYSSIPKDKVIFETSEDKFIQNILYANGICFEYRDGYAKISCEKYLFLYEHKYFMLKGVDDKYFKGQIEFFNLSKYENEFEINPSTTVTNFKSSYKSNRESKYQKIIKLINESPDYIEEPSDEVEFNTEDNYDELYKGNGITNGKSVLISKDGVMLIAVFSGDNMFVYSYTSTEEEGKTMLTVGEMNEEKSYITIKEDDEIVCEITPGLHNCKTIKEKCGDEYNTILEDKKKYLNIPSYIENNKLYYQNEIEGYEIYEVSNADIHYKIDHPRIKDYSIKSYEMWSWHRFYSEYYSGIVLQTNTSILGIYDKCYYETCSGYEFYNYSFNPIDTDIELGEDKVHYFHLVENDSRICFENEESKNYEGITYLINECYKVKKPEEVIEQFKTDFPELLQKAKTFIEENYDKITKGEVKSIKENMKVNEKKLRNEEEKGYYYEYYYNEYTYNYNGNDDDRYLHYRGYFITSNQFIIIYQYGGDINNNNPEEIYQIKLIYDITIKNSLNINDFDCELSEIELPCSGEEDCPNSKKTFKDYFDNCNNKEDMNVYLNDLVDTKIDINIESKRINITKNDETFLIIPLQERELSLLKEEISIITKNTRGVALDKSYDAYLNSDGKKFMINIQKLRDTMIAIQNKNDSHKIMIIEFLNATEFITVEYFNTYHDYDFHTFTLPNADYCMSYKKVYHNWINKGKYPFINDFSGIKEKLLSSLETQFNAIYEDVFNSMKKEPIEDKTESPDVTIQPTIELDDEGNIMKISVSLLIIMIMIMMILI